MLSLFARRRKVAKAALGDMQKRFGNLSERADMPYVTTQIAVYNEINVVERIMRAACKMKYPAGKHEIQVLDDSTDETYALTERLAAELRTEGHDIKVLHRDNRIGYKAGALDEGVKQAKGEFIAVFDADFVPPEDYLLSAVPFLMEDDKIGFVQARWGHLNRRHSLLTRVQSIGIDGHFIIEQIARNWNGLFMNFNGTAGMWRKKAIETSGGWQWETLTEDLDLSYRVQFNGWTTMYLPNLIVPAELPEDINAFRNQQFRWAKGSVQTLIKLFPQLIKAKVSLFKKLQAVIHMGGYIVHPLMLTLSLLALPVLIISMDFDPPKWIFAILAVPLAFSVIAPSTMYVVSQKSAHKNWLSRIALMPALMVIGVGLAVSNTKAIIQAIAGHESEFVRTPKSGDTTIKSYKTKLPFIAVVEVMLGIYCAYSLSIFIGTGHFLSSFFIAIYTAGFLFIGLLTFAHSFGFSKR
jgi:cellulose synthase/poly-beta-1,6-N-acetylglucosamine synthase-like glycosyltransferase